MKRVIILLMSLSLFVLTACSATPKAEEKPVSEKKVSLMMPVGSGYFEYIVSQIKPVIEPLGVESIEVVSAENDTQTGVNQIQNYTVKGVDVMYIFPAGDASAFADVVKEATDAGIITIVSHNSTGEGTATALIQADELKMGIMMSRMVDLWVDNNYPDAAVGSVKMLVLEQSLIPDMIKRSTGMKLIVEKFLRKIDMTTGKYQKFEGGVVSYVDATGATKEVDEPTGGLVLDSKGNAILNPYYNDKVKLVELTNRTIGDNLAAQDALDIAFTANGGENSDIKIVAAYAGEAAIGASEKLLAMHASGTIKGDLSGFAAFGADITKYNIDLIKASADNTSLLRGIMTNGDIVGTIAKTIKSAILGETLKADSWEPIGYMTLNEDKTDVVEVLDDGSLPASKDFLD